MWSVGVIIYVTLVGYPPFMEEDQRVLFKKIRYGEYTFYEEDWVGISQEAKDLIRHLLVVDPDRRMTASNALKHSWFNKVDERCLSLANKVPSIRELKDSIGDIDEFHQPQNKNFKSFKELPNESFGGHPTQKVPESMKEKNYNSVKFNNDDHTRSENVGKEETQSILIEEGNVQSRSSSHLGPNSTPVSSQQQRSPSATSRSDVKPLTSSQPRRSTTVTSRSSEINRKVLEVKPKTSSQPRRSPSAKAPSSEVKPSISSQPRRSPTTTTIRSEKKHSASSQPLRSPTATTSRPEVKPKTSSQPRRSPTS